MTLTRGTRNEKGLLFMPYGETAKAVTQTKQVRIPIEIEVIEDCRAFHSEYLPTFELINLKDGNYFATIFASGHGGQLEINLMTQ